VQTVRVRTPQGDALRSAVALAGGHLAAVPDGAFVVQGLAPDQIGDLAFERGIRLHELAQAHASLEEAFMELTASSVEFHASTGVDGSGTGAAATGAGEPGPEGTAQPVTTGEVL
jgi:ABC-2 type transport system ATP-binding protein